MSAFAASSQSFTAFATRMKEGLDQMITRAQISASPLLAQLSWDSTGVRRDDLGRNWLLKKVLEFGKGGSIKWTNPGGHATGMDVRETMYQNQMLRNSEGWDGVSASVLPQYKDYSFTLAAMKGNVHFDVNLMRTDQMKANLGGVGQLLGTTLRENASLIALAESVNFYSEDPVKKKVNTISAVAAAGNRLTLTLSGPIRRGLEVGVMIDIYGPSSQPHATTPGTSSSSSSANDQRNDGYKLLIDNLDPFEKTITVIDPTGVETLTTADAEVGDDIYLRASYGKGMYSLLSFLKSNNSSITNDRYILDNATTGIDTSLYSQLKSYRIDASGVFDESVWLQIMGPYMRAVAGSDNEPDTFVFSPGILDQIAVNMHTLHEAGTSAGYWNFDRQNQQLKSVYGYDHIELNYDGKRYRAFRDPNMPAETMYGIKLAGNFKRHVPPRPAGAGSAGNYPSQVEFAAPIFGRSGIWMEQLNGDGGLEELIQAPWTVHMQLMADKFSGLIVTGLTEITALSAPS